RERRGAELPGGLLDPLTLLELLERLARQGLRPVARSEDAAGHGADGVGVAAQGDDELEHGGELAEPARQMDRGDRRAARLHAAAQAPAHFLVIHLPGGETQELLELRRPR